MADLNKAKRNPFLKSGKKEEKNHRKEKEAENASSTHLPLLPS